ncbi:malonate decarboxylase holo-[acyl-carrier-protein] synthase [Variovorax ginsengisoli]|uniref:Phosphoribosyl-dephospho-CoA transferase n=1 Tax=Variovorax ginsengisoli TaxID=363844 RepID=A0ABT9SC08_9BURK|nr:malonate decarboxylase holo-[acyl-carrier-protein] synthase [Variovorax ginsengisoli]MDP9901745.1 phosphoribosyl-dephospho-CoA transferase [Variovorax ginsengisoli]
MPSLRRHQLVRLNDAGWGSILQHPWDAQALACLTHWSTHGLPLVVTRQSAAERHEGAIALGLPAPLHWGKRRLTLQAAQADVLGFDEFPQLLQVRPLLAVRADAALHDLACALDTCGAKARVFGSYGWQAITGMPFVHPASDLDLCIAVDGIAQADAVALALASCAAPLPRLDGELAFDSGASVAWREWLEWRSGRARAVLVKHLSTVTLEHGTDWCAHAGAEVVQ